MPKTIADALADGTLDKRYIDSSGRPTLPPNTPVNSKGMPYSQSISAGEGNVPKEVWDGWKKANAGPVVNSSQTVPNNSAPASALTVTPATLSAVDPGLGLVMKDESGGRNILTTAATPAYYRSLGMSPNLKSSAGGYFQITDPTWREAAAMVGIDGQYSRAMDAPFDVQYKAAQALRDKYGYRPWVPYNTKLAADLGYATGNNGFSSGLRNLSPTGEGTDFQALGGQVKDALGASGVPAERPVINVNLGSEQPDQSPYSRMLALSMIQKLQASGTHSIERVDYDPFAVIGGQIKRTIQS